MPIPAFGDRIGTPDRHAHLPGYGPRAATAFGHPCCDGLRHEKCAVDMNRHGLLENSQSLGKRWNCAVADTGIVHQNVDLPKGLHRLVDHAANFVFARDVGPHRQMPLARRC